MFQLQHNPGINWSACVCNRVAVRIKTVSNLLRNKYTANKIKIYRTITSDKAQKNNQGSSEFKRMCFAIFWANFWRTDRVTKIQTHSTTTSFWPPLRCRWSSPCRQCSAWAIRHWDTHDFAIAISVFFAISKKKHFKTTVLAIACAARILRSFK